MERVAGLLLTTAIAIAAYQLQTYTGPVDAMLIAIVIGILFRTIFGLPARIAPGVKVSVLSIMPLGIVLMGAKLDFYAVARTSLSALAISVVCVGVAFGMTIWLCKKLGVTQKLGLLIGVGTAICGGTAIAVAAPVIEADDNDTAFAIATVTLFGMVAVFVLPLLGSAIGMSQHEFGVWAGTSVHATPQVVATGFAYGPAAGDTATIVKLVRVLLLAPVVIGLAVWYARGKRARDVAHVTRIGSLTSLFPPFILGFVLLALANTLHLLPDFTLHLKQSFVWDGGDRTIVLATLATQVSSFLLTISMAGVGIGVDLRALRRVGLGALYVGLIASVLLAGASFALLRAFL